MRLGSITVFLQIRIRVLTVRLSDENTAENVQEKNQFSRFRILQTEVGEHFYVKYSLVMLTFRVEVKRLYSDNTFGHAPDSCIGWRYFVSLVNDLKFRDMALGQNDNSFHRLTNNSTRENTHVPAK